MSRAHISESERSFNVKSSTYYFRMKTKVFASFQICISVPLKIGSFLPYNFCKSLMFDLLIEEIPFKMVIVYIFVGTKYIKDVMF